MNLLKQTFRVLLLLLQAICEEQALLDTALSSGWCLSNGLDKSITYVIGSITGDLIVLSYVHDSLIKFTLDHFVISEPLLADGQISLDICVALAS